MRTNLGPTVNLDFLDGYLFRMLQEIAEARGLEDSGLLSYYGVRIEQKIGGLIEYEERLARYLLASFPGRRVVHAGIGIGTLTCALACNGMTVAGIESMPQRVESARQIRAAIVGIWPEVGDRYEIIEGFYPEALAGSAWLDSNAILIFTNVGAGWNDVVLDSVIQSMPRFEEVFLDLRLFGSVRERDEDRTVLFKRIAASAKWAEKLPHVATGVHLARFVFA